MGRVDAGAGHDHARRCRRHGRGQGGADRVGAVAADLPGHVRPARRRAAARRAALRSARLRQDVPGQGDRRHRQGQRAVGQGRRAAVEVGRRQRTSGPRAVPPGPRRRADAGLPGRGRRAGADARSVDRRRHDRSRRRGVADRVGRRRVAAQRRRDRARPTVRTWSTRRCCGPGGWSGSSTSRRRTPTARAEILRAAAKSVPLDSDVDLAALARRRWTASRRPTAPR